MTGAPWWASGDVEGPDTADDPLAAHLAARRGMAGGEDPDVEGRADAEDEGRADPGAADPGAADPGAADPGRAGHDPEICGVCPICRGWAAVAANRPEVAEHLADAARALAAALTHLADAATAAGDARAGDATSGVPPGHDPSPSAGFRPILLEDPEDGGGPGDGTTDEETA